MVLAEDEMLKKIINIRDEVSQNSEKKRYMKSSTFWEDLLHVKSKHPKTVEEVKHLLDQQNLIVSVGSEEVFGKESDDDWIFLSFFEVPDPGEEFFNEMNARVYESEREVEVYFVRNLLDKLGYKYEDISVGFTIKKMEGARKKRPKFADFAIFDGAGRDKEDTLLIVEAKIKDINLDDIEEAEYYAHALLPAYYVITNGKSIMVYSFNGMIIHDREVMKLDVSELKEQWTNLYKCISREATKARKKEIEKTFLKRVID